MHHGLISAHLCRLCRSRCEGCDGAEIFAVCPHHQALFCATRPALGLGSRPRPPRDPAGLVAAQPGPASLVAPQLRTFPTGTARYI